MFAATLSRRLGLRGVHYGWVVVAATFLVALTTAGAMGLAVACRIEGSIPHALATRGVRPEEIRVAHPSGTLSVGAEVRQDNHGWQADSAVVFRTQRRLMQGAVAIPA